MSFKIRVMSYIFIIACGLSNAFATEQFFKEEVPCDPLTQGQLNDIGNRSVLESFKLVNENWEYTEQQSDIKTDALGWKIEVVSYGRGLTTSLRWDQQLQPSIHGALKCLLNSRTRGECLNAARIVKIKLLLDVLGDERMDPLIARLIATYKQASFSFFSTLSWLFQTPCAEDFQGIYSMAFVNIPLYQEYKPEGNAQNHNVIRLSDGTFVGFDPDFFARPRTYDELERHMYEEFISEHNVINHNRAAHEQFCDMMQSEGGFEYFKRLRRNFQAEHTIYRFDVSKIQDYIRTGEF